MSENRGPRLTAKAQRALDDVFDVEKETYELMRLIDAEFQTDPMSQQCFDARIVERVRVAVAKRKELEKHLPIWF